MANILILEDDLQSLRLYTRATEAAGHAVLSVSSLQSAMTAVNHRMVDLCISELRVGDSEPRVVIKQMARIHLRQRIPVIMISAHMDFYLDTCYAAGLEHVLQKPFPPHELTTLVQTLLEDSEMML